MATPNLKRYVSREFDQDDFGKFSNDEVNIFLNRSRARNSMFHQQRAYDVTHPPSNDNQGRKSDGDDGFVILNLGREDVSEAVNVERTEVMSLYPVLATPSNRHSGRGSETGRSSLSAASRRLASATSSGDSVFDDHDGVCSLENVSENGRQSNLIFSASVQPEKHDASNHCVKFDISDENDSSNDNKLERLKTTDKADKDESDEKETLDPSTRSCYVYTLLGLTCLLVLVSAYMALYLYLQWSRLDDPSTLHSVQETLVEFVLFVLAVLLINSLLIIRIFP